VNKHTNTQTNKHQIPEVNENASDNLLDGRVDEDANRRAFLQALYEWRNGGKSDVDKASEQDKGKENQRNEPVKMRTSSTVKASKHPASGRPAMVSFGLDFFPTSFCFVLLYLVLAELFWVFG
jgi:hypothetical protein